MNKIPNFGFVLIAIAVGMVVFFLGRDIAQWLHNNSQPVSTQSAIVVAKRVKQRDVGPKNHSRTQATHYVTFELPDSGQQIEYRVSQDEYETIAERDFGELACQGTRFRGFSTAEQTQLR